MTVAGFIRSQGERGPQPTYTRLSSSTYSLGECIMRAYEELDSSGCQNSPKETEITTPFTELWKGSFPNHFHVGHLLMLSMRLCHFKTDTLIVCGCVHGMAHVWRSEENSQESVLSSITWIPGIKLSLSCWQQAPYSEPSCWASISSS